MSTPRHRSPPSPPVFETPASSARWSRPGRWEVPAVVLVVLPVLAVVAEFAGSVWSRLQPDQNQVGKPSGVSRRQTTGATVALLAIVVLVAAVGPVQAYYATPKLDWKTLGWVLTAVALPTDTTMAQEKAACNLSWYCPQVEETDGELLPGWQQLCENHAKVSLAIMPNDPLRGTDADWVSEGFVEVPLRDLKLLYRNCRAEANWYGEGGDPQFEMAFDTRMPFWPTLQAYDQYLGALWLAGDDLDVYFVLGFALDRLDRPQEAIAAFRAGHQLDPSREGPHQALEGLLEQSEG